MAGSIKNVVIIGAAGNLGPEVLQEFLKSSLNVTVFTRAESKSTFPSGVKVVRTDYSPESLEQQFKGQDAVVSLVGNSGFADQVKLIDAAVKAGVKRFIPSEFGFNSGDERVIKIIPILAGKKQVVEYLKSKESQGLSWTGVISGPFFDWGIRIGFLGFDVVNHTATIWDGGNTPVSEATLAQIGRTLVAILSPEHFEKTKNEYVFFDSFTVTQNETLAALEKVSGKKWTIKEEIKSSDVIQPSLEKLQKGDFSAAPPLLLATAYTPEAISDSRKVPGGLWNDRLGLPKENFEETIRSILEAGPLQMPESH